MTSASGPPFAIIAKVATVLAVVPSRSANYPSAVVPSKDELSIICAEANRKGLQDVWGYSIVDRLTYRLLALQLLTLVVVPSEGLLHHRVHFDKPGPEAKVSTSYDALRGISSGLHQVDRAGANALASVLVAPSLPSGASALFQSDERSSALPSTHVAYNCTTTSSIWNLEQDPNVLELEHFTTVSGDIEAAATVWAVDCDPLLHSSVGRVVIANAFFGAAFSSAPAYFDVVNSVVLTVNDSNASRSSKTGTCRVKLELKQATFAQVYPDCRITFHSTDLANLIQTESVEAVAAVKERRKLEASSFGFVKDAACSFDCGEEGKAGEIDVDKCWAKDGDDTWTEAQCTLQFYVKNSKCSTECGYGGDDETLSPSQCYDCSSSAGSCASGYNSTDDGCCRVLECDAVDDTTITSPGTLAWNLEDDRRTVSNASYPIFETGNCSDTSDPSTDCCRITCENCFLNVSVASMFAEVEVKAASYDEAIEMGLTGNSNLEVALYAPNGCTLNETTQLKNASFSIPLGETGISIEIAMGLDLRRKFSLQPHGSIATIGATADLQRLTAGSLRSETFHDVHITSNISSKLAQSSIDLELELELTPSFQASLSLLNGVGQVGVKAEFLVFLELNSTFQFPDPFPALSSEYLDAASLWHGGDCLLPHYMEYNCNAGYGEVNISIPMSVKIPAIGNKTLELDIVSSSDRSSYSLFSGCVATAYDVEILLSTAIDAVASLSREKKQKLQTILTWVLGMTDIDSDFVNITSVSDITGEISVTLSVPPSLGELYPDASAFQKEVYRRARNVTFSSAVAKYVGLELTAHCDDGWWGSECDQECSEDHCSNGNSTCNAVDGTFVSCRSCEDGYWGETCNNACQVPDACTNARCNQTSGGEVECVSCDGDQESSLCGSSASGSARSWHIGTASVLVPLIFGLIAIS
ncbi:hypothetical protein PHYPSEUDO_011177 [Phytophthora pseudosyringae]|uniref:Uncharacterized protein n=1 Tax=Phytophthora pseudosyringae TaxID=221518 RepID=A0A8T1V9I9_9STRA|nr:hypothetical protein PHYPSEUDO_011177 [Phytophthora pseudosyringae]